MCHRRFLSLILRLSLSHSRLPASLHVPLVMWVEWGKRIFGEKPSLESGKSPTSTDDNLVLPLVQGFPSHLLSSRETRAWFLCQNFLFSELNMCTCTNIHACPLHNTKLSGMLTSRCSSFQIDILSWNMAPSPPQVRKLPVGLKGISWCSWISSNFVWKFFCVLNLLGNL